MDVEPFLLNKDVYRWSATVNNNRSSFEAPSKKWKSSRIVDRNGSLAHVENYANSSIGRNAPPITIKLIPYSNSANTTRTVFQSKSVEREKNLKTSSIYSNNGGEWTMRNGSEREGRLFSPSSTSYLVRDLLLTSNSHPPKLSCSSSVVRSNSNNNTSSSSSSIGKQYRQNCCDKIAKSSFVGDDVEKPTSSFSLANGAKLRAAKSESSLRAMSQQQPTLLNDRDQDQVEMMYGSRGTKVFVCSCLANLYFDQSQPSNNYSSQIPSVQWELIVTGIPVVLMNCGESRSRSNRQLQIILAERGTGFTLWKEVITDFSRYEEAERTFHTLTTSAEPKRLAGLSFDDAFSAVKFYQHLKAMHEEHSDISSSKNKSSSNSKQRRHSFVGGGGAASSKKVILRKVDISTPVCFKHITSVKPADVNPVMMCAGNALVQKRAQSCVQILTLGDGSNKSIQ